MAFPSFSTWVLTLFFLSTYGGKLWIIEARLNDPEVVPFTVLTTSMSSPNNNNIPGLFDFFILSMHYLPEFCYLNRSNSFPGCQKPDSSWRGSLTIHGLWPENEDGSHPSNCSNEEFRMSTVDHLGKERFETYWPNVEEVSSSSSYTEFWRHEWTKHGTCSGLSQDEYFEMTLNHFLPSPGILAENYGSSVSKEELTKAYGGNELDIVFVCSRGNFLKEVRVCLAKMNNGSERVNCSPTVLKEGSCGDVIHISKFYVDVDGDDGHFSVEREVGLNGKVEIE